MSVGHSRLARTCVTGEAPALAGGLADLGRDVRVAQEDPVGGARHHPEQDEVEDDDEEDRPDRLDDLVQQITRAHRNDPRDR